MSCISSNFSSFFLTSLNDPSEFTKYLSNGEIRFSSTFEDFQVCGQSNGQQQQQQQHCNGGVGVLVNANGELISSNGDEGNSNIENTQPVAVTSAQNYGSFQVQNQQQMQQHHGHHQPQQTRWASPHQQANHTQNLSQNTGASASPASVISSAAGGSHHFDGSFEFMKYLRHSNDYTDNSHDGTAGQQNQTQSSHPTTVGTKPESSTNNGLMDLDSAHKRASARKTPVLSSANNNNHHNPTATASSHSTPMDIYDHDSKHNIYDLHHMNSAHSSNSNESSMELSSMTYPNSHLNASNSNTSSEGGNTQNHSDFSMLSGAANSQNATANTTSSKANAAASASPEVPKPLATFTIKDNFEAHPSHKVEEGIFQHMNKLPPKKKENLKQLGVRFTGQMTLNDKSIIVENFIKFCQEYEIKDHRPFLSLNQSGLNKPDQIKFARYLGQGLPTFTLFCIYSNFKNLFCTKRTEIYTKDGYNLPYILDKIKRFLANTTAGNNNNASNSNSSSTSTTTKDSCSNTNSTNSNSTPHTTGVSTNNSNNIAASAVPVAMQNGKSSSSNDNSKGSSTGSSNSSIINNDIINTPTKQIYNVPSPATPRTPQTQQQQTPQIPIQTQNTPLPAHPPPSPQANHTSTPQTHLHPQHHQQQLLQQQQPPHPHLHHHVQMPMSPMAVVTPAASLAGPTIIMGSPLLPTVAGQPIVTQPPSNHSQQHPHHMQPNNHLPPHHHPHHQHHHHHLVQPIVQPSIQHHAAAVVYHQQQQQPHQHQQQHQQQHHQQQPQQQNHHPLHTLAAQNPPL